VIYRFCPQCGGSLRVGFPLGEGRPPLTCGSCGFAFYQNSKPAAGALVVHDGKVLLVKRRVAPARGAWDIPGGFLELGEHPREGAIRELREETGLGIRLFEPIGIYVDKYGDDVWTLNIYYEAGIREGTPRPGSDAYSLAWFKPDELPSDLAFPHQHEMLANWRVRFKE